MRMCHVDRDILMRVLADQEVDAYEGLSRRDLKRAMTVDDDDDSPPPRPEKPSRRNLRRAA